MNMYIPPPPQFYLFPKRKNSDALQAKMYVKVSFEGKLHEKSLNVNCPYEQWDSKMQSIQDSPLENFQLKQSFDGFREKVMGAYYMLLRQTPDFILQDILDMAIGSQKPGVFSFIRCFEELITRMEKSKGQEGNSVTNIQKHKRCLQFFRTYLQSYLNTTDLTFARINRSTIDELAQYLRNECRCSHNTAMKYMQIIKKAYRVGMDNGWVKVNAFANFKFKIRVVERHCLTEEELQALMNKTFEIKRLEFVKDIFLFSCFTGLAYIDIRNLKRENIFITNGEEWIKIKRKKTGIDSSIPLLEPARNIIEKYDPKWLTKRNSEPLLNIISNQKMNAYLKEIAAIAGIHKEITFHLARHTFATTVTLSNDVPIESVSKMLGHTRITMTQHYSKVIDGKIARDMAKLNGKYK
jgi:site-specific recombinase XerD